MGSRQQKERNVSNDNKMFFAFKNTNKKKCTSSFVKIEHHKRHAALLLDRTACIKIDSAGDITITTFLALGHSSDSNGAFLCRYV